MRSNIRAEIQQSKESLETATKLTADALKRANEVYDEALTLFANVSALAAPEINLERLKQESAKAIDEVRIFLKVWKILTVSSNISLYLGSTIANRN